MSEEPLVLILLNITVMRFTQDGMPVKSMDVPEVEATAVPDTNTVPEAVPVNVGLLKVGEVKVGVVSDRFAAKYVDPTDPAVAGMAFNTLDTKKLSTVTRSPELAALVSTTVVPFVAV